MKLVRRCNTESVEQTLVGNDSYQKYRHELLMLRRMQDDLGMQETILFSRHLLIRNRSMDSLGGLITRKQHTKAERKIAANLTTACRSVFVVYEDPQHCMGAVQTRVPKPTSSSGRTRWLGKLLTNQEGLRKNENCRTLERPGFEKK